MKRCVVCVCLASAMLFAAAPSARAQGFGIGFGSYGPGLGGYNSGFGYGPSVGLRVGPSINYGGYGYRPSYGSLYGGYGSLNRSVYNYGHVSPAYAVRRPVSYGYRRVFTRRCR